jgi:hypothetical protein
MEHDKAARYYARKLHVTRREAADLLLAHRLTHALPDLRRVRPTGHGPDD